MCDLSLEKYVTPLHTLNSFQKLLHAQTTPFLKFPFTDFTILTVVVLWVRRNCNFFAPILLQTPLQIVYSSSELCCLRFCFYTNKTERARAEFRILWQPIQNNGWMITDQYSKSSVPIKRPVPQPAQNAFFFVICVDLTKKKCFSKQHHLCVFKVQYEPSSNKYIVNFLPNSGASSVRSVSSQFGDFVQKPQILGFLVRMTACIRALNYPNLRPKFSRYPSCDCEVRNDEV